MKIKMKSLNVKLLVLVLACHFSVTSTDAHANVFDKIRDAKEKVIEGGKKAVDKIKETTPKVIETAKEVGAKAREVSKKTIEEVSDKISEYNESNRIPDNSTTTSNTTNTTSTTTTQKSQSSQNLGQNPKQGSTQTKIATARNTSVTDDSVINLDGTIDSNVNWIMFKITKGEQSYRYIVPTENGSYNAVLPFKLGAGEYVVDYFYSTATTKASSYMLNSTKIFINNDTRDMSYLLPTEYSQSTHDDIVSLAEHITRGATTEREKLFLLNDWMKSNITYDYDAYTTGSYQSYPYDALTVLNDKKAVCAGFSNLFASLSRAAGIKTQVVYGTGKVGTKWSPHGWNKVLVDGAWLNIDTTWNQGTRSNKYFLIADEIFNRDHQAESVMDIM